MASGGAPSSVLEKRDRQSFVVKRPPRSLNRCMSRPCQQPALTTTEGLPFLWDSPDPPAPQVARRPVHMRAVRGAAKPGASPVVGEPELRASPRPVLDTSAVLNVPALLSVATTAQILHCSPRTIRRRIASGALPAVIEHGRTMVRGDELRAYIDQLERAGGSPPRRRASGRRFDFLRAADGAPVERAC